MENYFGVLPVLKKNLENLKSIQNYEIISQDIVKSLKFKNFNKKFDIIFLDPPYRDKNLKIVLTNIFEQKILDENGLIIIHRHKKEKDEFPSFFSIIDEKQYGISKIIFLSLILN